MTPRPDDRDRAAKMARIHTALDRMLTQRLDMSLAASADDVREIPAPFATLPEGKAKPASTGPNANGTPSRGRNTRASGAALVDALNALVAANAGGRPAPARDAPTGGYLARVVSGELTDVELLRRAREHRLHVLLEGFPGVGKTELVRAAFEGELEQVDGHGDCDVSELIGSYVPRPGGEFAWREGPLLRALRLGRVLFMDDISRIPPGVLARLYPAMDARAEVTVNEGPACETVAAQRGFAVVGAHNPGVAGAMIDAPLRSRFAISLEVETDVRVALELGVPAPVARVAEVLRELRSDGGIGWAPEMRELLQFTDIARWAGNPVAAANLLAHAPPEDRAEVAEQLALAYPGVRRLTTGPS